MAEMAGFCNHQHVCPIPMKGLDCTPSFQNASLAPAGIQLFPELLFSADFSFLHSCQTPEAIIYLFSNYWLGLAPIHRDVLHGITLKIQMLCPKSMVCFTDPYFPGHLSRFNLAYSSPSLEENPRFSWVNLRAQPLCSYFSKFFDGHC